MRDIRQFLQANECPTPDSSFLSLDFRLDRAWRLLSADFAAGPQAKSSNLASSAT